jgi:predicted nucleic acid-binding protein
MYLVDTDVISESRKGIGANKGVRAFFQAVAADDYPLYLSAITIGELRRGVEKIRHRGDLEQANHLERWLMRLVEQYAEAILAFDDEIAQVWGRLRVPHAESPIDKQIAATALIHDLTVVTRYAVDFLPTGVRVFNPFGS